MTDNNLTFDCRWTTEVDRKFLKDWQYVTNTVFGNFTDEIIHRKYFENIYGPSIMIVAYLDNEPVGADALWRNDVDGKEAYQSCDTCVLEAARGKGVMKQFTQIEIAKAPQGVYIYGCPNENSLPGYKRMGWNIKPIYCNLFLCPYQFRKENPELMPKEYAKWWIFGDDKFYIRILFHYYLIRLIPNKTRKVEMIAEVEKETALLYPKYKKFAFGLFVSKGRPRLPMFRQGSSNFISLNGNPLLFLSWKLDSYAHSLVST